MSPADASRTLLAAELRRDWDFIDKHVSRAHSVAAADSQPAAALVALSLDHAYQAFETMLVRIERALGLPARTGADWHAHLLDDAALNLAALRAEVIPASSLPDWHKLRRFRHFLRHAYAVELDAEELTRTATALQRAIAGSQSTIAQLITSLES